MKVIRGQAQAGEQDIVNAAPVCLVAFGCAKDATADQVKEFVVKNGLEVIDCELITTFSAARTNSFKITIHAKDYDKSQNPQIWPHRVGIRAYKHFRPKAPLWKEQSADPQPNQSTPHVAEKVAVPNSVPIVQNLGNGFRISATGHIVPNVPTQNKFNALTVEAQA